MCVCAQAICLRIKEVFSEHGAFRQNVLQNRACVPDNTLSHCRVRDLQFGSAMILRFLYFLSLFPFWISVVNSFWKCWPLTAVLRGLAERVVSYFSVSSLSVMEPERKVETNSEEKVSCPQQGFLQEIFFSPCSNLENLCFVCFWRQFPWLRAFSFVGISPQEFLLKSNKHIVRQVRQGEWMNMGMPFLIPVAVLWARRDLCGT